jgi:hypothetical protein
VHKDVHLAISSLLEAIKSERDEQAWSNHSNHNVSQLEKRETRNYLGQKIGLITGQLVDRHSFWSESISDITIETAPGLWIHAPLVEYFLPR